MPTITPFLWFDGRVREAVDFYTSIFDDSAVLGTTEYPEGAPGPGGLMTASFRLAGQEFVALNGGPQFTFNPSISFVITCGEQDEVDYYWDRLVAGGQESQCGWLVDRFGLSWQVVPAELDKYLADPDPERAQRVMQAMLPMTKIDLEQIRAAYHATT